MAEFFEALPNVTLTAAQVGANLAYTTVLRARDHGEGCGPKTLKALEKWSRTVPEAIAAGVWIDPAKTLGLSPTVHGGIGVDSIGPVVVREGYDQRAERPSLTGTEG